MKQNLIFIHGFRGNGLGLKGLAEKYFPSEKYNTFTPSLPPAGGKTLKEYSPKNYARFIADYIKEKNIKSPILIGHSMGSIIVAAIAERYPELINKKIIFLAPISTHPPRLFAALSPLTSVLPNKVVSYITTGYLFVPNDKELLKKTLQMTYLCGSDYTTKRDVYRSAKFSSNYCIADFSYKKEACFIIGEKDRVVSVTKSKELAEKTKGETIIIKNAGHLLNYELPKETAEAIKSFIEKS